MRKKLIGALVILALLNVSPLRAGEQSGGYDTTIVKSDGSEKAKKKLRCNFHKTKACQDAFSSKTDSAGHAVQHCNYLKTSDNACTTEQVLAIGYTSMAAVCGFVCLAYAGLYTAAAAAALEPVCFYGTLALGVGDMVASLAIKSSAKKAAAEAEAVIAKDYGLTAPMASLVLNGAFSLYGMAGMAVAKGGASSLATKYVDKANKATDLISKEGASTSDAAKGNAACLSAITNAAFATFKWINKSNIVKNSEANYQNLLELQSDAPPPLTPQTPTLAPTLAAVTGEGAPPPIGDSRSASVEVPVKDDKLDLARIGESYATADTAKLFGNPSPQDFRKAFDALSDRTGLTPDGLLSALEDNGVAGTLGQLMPSDEAGKALADTFKDIEAQAAKDLAGKNPMLAFERSAGGDAGGGRKGGAGESPFGGLFGARGPAEAGGGLKDIQFGGFGGDIWHAGTSLSIFEIVSRKTQAVSARVQQ